MKRIFLFIFLSILSISSIGLGAERCLKFEPVIEELTGCIKPEVFPGRPNYEDLNKGDEPMQYWILYLEEPVCISPTRKNDELNGNVSSIKEIQLVINNYDKYRGLLCKRVKIKGRLFSAHTAHHVKQILLTVNEMIEAPNQ